MERNWWLSVIFLSAFMGLGGVANSGQIADDSITHESVTGNATYTTAVVTAREIELSNGTTIFNNTLTVGYTDPSKIGPSYDYGIYITGGTNTFEKDVTAGYLATGEENSINVFKDKVTLWDEDRDPSDNEPLLGHSLGILAGVNTFEKDIISGDPDNGTLEDAKDSLFLNSETTILGNLTSRWSNLNIGYNEWQFKEKGIDDILSPLANSETKVIFGDGTQAIDINVSHAYVGKNATIEAKSDVRYEGALILLYNAQYTADGKTQAYHMSIGEEDEAGTFSGKAVFNDDVTVHTSLSIGGQGMAIFEENVNIGNKSSWDEEDEHDLYIDGGTNTFKGKVTAGSMATEIHSSGKTASTNVFEDTVELWGHNVTELVDYSLILASGTNTFEKSVTNTTTGKSALFINSATTFKDKLDIGTGDINIGYFASISDIAGMENKSTEVILASTNAKLKGSNINIGKGGTLTLLADGAIEGKTIFKNGSTLEVGLNTLSIIGDVTFESGSIYAATLGESKNSLVTVSGKATIENGANLFLKGVDPSKAVNQTILNSTNAITGAFTNSLYDIILSSDGKNMEIGGIKSAASVVENALGAGNISSNFVRAAGVANQVMAEGGQLGTKVGDALQTAAVMAASDHELGKVAFSQLFGEHGVTGVTASQTTAQNFSNSIGNHQIQLRDNAQASAAANSPTAFASLRSINQGYSSSFNPNRIWGGGFGAWTRQDDKDNQYGYKYNSGGFILGYDREVGDFIFGISSAYSAGQIKNNEGFTKTDVDTFNVGVYASYNHCSGFFVDANAGFGYAWNEVKTTDVISGGRKEGKYRNNSFQIGTNIGYDFTLPTNFHIIPSVGVQYTHVHQKGWNEKIQSESQIANWFDKTNSDYVSIPVQLRINKTFAVGECAVITPEIRGAWIYEAKDPQAHVRMGYVGSGASTTLYGVDSGRSRGLVGAGVKAKFNRNIDAFVDYNYEFRSGYKNHNVMAGLGVSF